MRWVGLSHVRLSPVDNKVWRRVSRIVLKSPLKKCRRSQDEQAVLRVQTAVLQTGEFSLDSRIYTHFETCNV